MLRFLVAATLAMLTASCATAPPVVSDSRMCGFAMWKAEVQQPPIAMPDPNFLAVEPVNADLLMSGGGQHGAFGAGLLEAWAYMHDGHLPRFRSVTGISTGAMVSTFAFIDRPEVGGAAYAIKSEGEILKPYAHKTKRGGFTLPSYLAIAKHNAVGDLAPLREQLHRRITLEVLQEVTRQSFHRRLLVGAVDVDSGDAMVFDLTDMARRASEAPPERKERFRDCYIEAIMASGSVPLAAKPVFIDNREYIDGGARFGVFLDGYGQSAGIPMVSRRPAAPGGIARPIRPAPPTSVPRLYVVVNGTQEVSPRCGKDPKGQGACGKDGSDPSDNLHGGHAKWSLIPLAKRASDILINQVYRFSVADIRQRFEDVYPGMADTHLLYMPIVSGDAAEFRDGELQQTCASLEQQDDRLLRPLEFHPSYMHCLVAYGRSFAEARCASLSAAYDGTARPDACDAFRRRRPAPPAVPGPLH